MKNIMLTIAYDGTGYGGWQRQANAVTVQEETEKALAEVLGAPVKLTGASRTDAGVHAFDQRACFFIEDGDFKIPPERLPLAVNPALPDGIVIKNAEEMPLSFHPRFHAKKKEYRYKILNAKYPDPLSRCQAWHVHYPLDTYKMRNAAAHIKGTHDFSAFCAAGSQIKDFTRTVEDITVAETPYNDGDCSRIIEIIISADGFLYNMVRIIAGTLMYAGCGKIAPEALPGIINGKNRAAAGITAPPQGLALWKIWY